MVRSHWATAALQAQFCYWRHKNEQPTHTTIGSVLGRFRLRNRSVWTNPHIDAFIYSKRTSIKHQRKQTNLRGGGRRRVRGVGVLSIKCSRPCSQPGVGWGAGGRCRGGGSGRSSGGARDASAVKCSIFMQFYAKNWLKNRLALPPAYRGWRPSLGNPRSASGNVKAHKMSYHRGNGKCWQTLMISSVRVLEILLASWWTARSRFLIQAFH